MRLHDLQWMLLGVPAIALLATADAATVAADLSAANTAWLEQEYQANRKLHRDNPDVLVMHGLLADRKRRYVDLLATATGADARIDTFITTVAGDSARSIAVSAASQDDVREALAFIDMRPGHPIDLSRTLYWPKGERVVMTFNWNNAGESRFRRSARAEKLILDSRWNEPLPELGFRFVGPAADAALSPGVAEIATARNAQNTLLEVPYVSGGQDPSGQLIANGDYRFAAGQKLRVRLRPEFRNGQQRVFDFLVDIAPGDGEDRQKLSNLRVKLTAMDDAAIVDGNFESVFVYLEKLVKEGKEPFVKLRYADELTLQSIKNIARFSQQFLVKQEIRIEPHAGHLIYSAFLPPEEWRNPRLRGRGSQPLEIYWRGAAGVAGELLQYPQTDGAAVKQFRFTNVTELIEVLERGKPWQTDGAFLMASPDLPYGAARQIIDQIRRDFPNVYVFL